MIWLSLSLFFLREEAVLFRYGSCHTQEGNPTIVDVLHITGLGLTLMLL